MCAPVALRTRTGRPSPRRRTSSSDARSRRDFRVRAPPPPPLQTTPGSRGDPLKVGSLNKNSRTRVSLWRKTKALISQRDAAKITAGSRFTGACDESGVEATSPRDEGPATRNTGPGEQRRSLCGWHYSDRWQGKNKSRPECRDRFLVIVRIKRESPGALCFVRGMRSRCRPTRGEQQTRPTLALASS